MFKKVSFSVADQVSRGNVSYRFVFFLMLLPLRRVVRTSRKSHRVLVHPEKYNRISNNNLKTNHVHVQVNNGEKNRERISNFRHTSIIPSQNSP